MLTIHSPYPVSFRGRGWEATVQVDLINKRLILDQYKVAHPEDWRALSGRLITLAREQGCGKVLADVRADEWIHLLTQGYHLECIIPAFFGGLDAYCLSYFIEPNRQAASYWQQENAVLERVLEAKPAPELDTELNRYHFREATPQDAVALCPLYATVFDSYPTPLDDPGYLANLIESKKAYFIVAEQTGQIVSAAAAECNWLNQHAEMTDCATLPSFRGQGLMAAILRRIERWTEQNGFLCLFSLARARSFGMNMVLRRLGYTYLGRRINNCHIMGSFEDMNLWAKQSAHRLPNRLNSRASAS